MIVTVTLNPSIDRTLYVKKLVPYDTNRVTSIEEDAGGKGLNVSRILQALGAKTLALALLGGKAGTQITDVLTAENVKYRKVLVNGESRTNISIEDETENPPTSVNPRGPTVSSEEWAEFCETFLEYCKEATWVVMSGSLPPGVPKDAYRQLGNWAKKANCKVCLDADGEVFGLGLECGPNLVKPNQSEAGKWLGRDIRTFDEAISGGKEILEKMEFHGADNPICLLSMGKEGAILISKEHGIYQGTSPGIVSNSTVGSGDSMIGGFLSSVERKDSIEANLRWGLAAGAATATTDGTKIGPVSVIELLFGQTIVKKLD